MASFRKLRKATQASGTIWRMPWKMGEKSVDATTKVLYEEKTALACPLSEVSKIG
jgi:hypothetical protein